MRRGTNATVMRKILFRGRSDCPALSFLICILRLKTRRQPAHRKITATSLSIYGAAFCHSVFAPTLGADTMIDGSFYRYTGRDRAFQAGPHRGLNSDFMTK